MTTNIEKAKQLINTFNTGDVALAKSLLATDYIQHNLNFGTGADAFLAAVEGLSLAPVKTTVKTIREFEDGDKVFLQSEYNFAGAGDQVVFDIFRFDAAGKIVEHWDNVADKAAPNPSGHTQIDGTLAVQAVDKEETRKLVSNFVVDVLHGAALEKIPTYFEGDAYIQHNTGIADGVSGLGAALEELAKLGIEMIYNKTHYVLAQGDFALAVSEGTFGGKETSYYDLFRVENGKIAEHWDVVETILPKTEWKNENGKF